MSETLLRGPILKDRPAPVARQVERKDISGKVLGTVNLAPEIFGIEPNVPVMHQVVTAQLAAKRSGTQSTKTRAEVRGGGAKPFNQKGTGRARQGSSRVPSMPGGGVAMGPKPRKYDQATPKKMVRLALRSALSDRASENNVILVDKFDFDAPKTKDALSALAAIGANGHVLLVLTDEEINATLSCRNLEHVTTLTADQLNTYDIIRNDVVVFTDATLPTMSTEGDEA
jgi:large subunit ribosomal protein L4